MARWNQSSESLRHEIREAFAEVPWNTLDVLRIGWDTQPSNETRGEQPVTLLVSVEPGSTTAAKGFLVATACKRVLEKHGIADVDCEIQESTVVDLGSFAPPEALKLSKQPFQMSKDNLFDLQTSDCLGAYIAAESGSDGTTCLYLHLREGNGDKKTVLLTCRHVLIGAVQSTTGEHRCSAEIPFEAVLQAGQLELSGIISKLDRIESRCSGRKNVNGVAADEKEYEAAKSHLNALRTLDSLPHRTIGHLLYAPAYEARQHSLASKLHQDRVSSLGLTGRWLPDWALAELHQDKYEALLHEINNRVHFPDDKLSELKANLATEAPTIQVRPDIDQRTKTLLLRKVIPASELFFPDTTRKDTIPAMLVGKHGQRTGLTFGFANAAKSILRRRFDKDTIGTKCDSWFIVNIKPKVPFGQPGDSGACIWDMSGRIGGMVLQGTEPGHPMPRTYAIPVEWVLDDIRSRGFEVDDP